MNVVATFTNHVVRGGLNVVFLGRPSGHRVKTNVGDLVAFKNPYVGAVVLANTARRRIFPFSRQVIVEESGGLDS